MILVVFPNYLLANSICDTVNVKNEKTVICTTYYENGQIERISSKHKGKRHGNNKSFFKNGQLEFSGNYSYGIFIDTAMGYYMSGKLESISTSTGDIIFFENGDTMAINHKKNSHSIGQRRWYYSGQRPERFTTFNDSGEKHGWEVFWYENGNVKDSTLFRNDSTMQGKSFYLNGKCSYEQKDIYSTNGYNAISYNPQGKKTGQVKNGTGTVFTCDSLGGNCHELQFKDGKRVFK